jgi:hypothetical protein
MIVQACDPSYPEDGGRRIASSKSVRANHADPISKIKCKQQSWVCVPSMIECLPKVGRQWVESPVDGSYLKHVFIAFPYILLSLYFLKMVFTLFCGFTDRITYVYFLVPSVGLLN